MEKFLNFQQGFNKLVGADLSAHPGGFIRLHRHMQKQSVFYNANRFVPAIYYCQSPYVSTFLLHKNRVTPIGKYQYKKSENSGK
jgi:hypothetical protein